MSYVDMRKTLDQQAELFRQDVFDYLEKTGRSEKGRAYFGVLAANNPNLVARLEAGKLPGLEVMIKVRAFMERHPPSVDPKGGAL